MTTRLILGVCLALVASAADAREWTTWNGSHTVHADLIGFTQGTAQLKRYDGETVNVPINTLCDDDVIYIARWLYEQKHGKKLIEEPPPPKPEPISRPKPTAQPKRAAAKPEYVDYTAGAQFRIKKPTIGASNYLFVDELRKAVLANDQEGMEGMVANGTFVLAGENDAIRVLEVHYKNQVNEYAFAECRLIRGGSAAGKIYIFGWSFTTESMEPID